MITDISSGTEIGINVALTNPKVSGVTDVFRIAILRENTKVIFDWKLEVPGVPITPGYINDISLTKREVNTITSRDKIVDYEL